MHFPTASATRRPVRLSRATRAWAWQVMHGAYGDEALRHPAIPMDDAPGFDALSPMDRQDAAIRAVCEKAPLRLCPEERIAGSATLGAAFQFGRHMNHILPATYQGEPIAYGVSHLTIRYDKVLHEGMDSYQQDIADKLCDPQLTADERRYLQSLRNAVDSMRLWHRRYLDATRDARPDIHALLCRVPFAPARNFREAVQALWFTFAFVRLTGNWPGIGRIDHLLGDYLQQDLKNGLIDKAEAREVLASFFIKGCEWIQRDTPRDSGDAQHYQNIVLAGVDEKGHDVTNPVTYLVLDVVEELGISDFPITVRLSPRTPEKLLRKAAQVMRHGGGVVAIYNEDLILRTLADLGYPENEARQFANDGCWEVQVPGRTCFGYTPFDALQLFNRTIGLTGDDPIPDYQNIEEIYAAFKKELADRVSLIYQQEIGDVFGPVSGRWERLNVPPHTPIIDLFEDGCIARARTYYGLGPVYTVRSPHIGGAPDVSNSLHAIQKAVFEDKLVTFPELVRILRRNWEGNEVLRQTIKNKYAYYGNDCDEPDAWHTRVLSDFADMVIALDGRDGCPVRFIPGVSTFGRQLEWLPQRCAAAFGARRGDILSGNDSPTPGTDFAGVTASIRSYCKADLQKQQCGAALDVKIFPESLKGENGVQALKAMMKGFVALGGFFLQVDTVDAQTLLAAREAPEKYKTLSVRVSGWNARFVTLCREWQDMIIERTTQHM